MASAGGDSGRLALTCRGLEIPIASGQVTAMERTDLIVQDYRVYGDGVNIAARLQTVADPGSICISEAVYQQVYTKVDLW